MVVRPFQLALLGALTATVAIAAACGGKKGSGSAFGPKGGAVEAPAPAAPPPAPPAVDPGAPTLSANQLRQLTSVVGRAVAGYGTANNTTPLAGVKFYGYVDKKQIESVSDENGFFFFKDVPVMSEGGVGKNLTLYVEKEGWELDAIPDILTTANTDTAGPLVTTAESPDGINNSFQIEVRASPDAPSAFQIDVGPIHFKEQSLKVTTSLHHATRTETSKWLSTGGTTVGPNANGQAQDVYLADPKASITLTFNRPIDTAYSDPRATFALVEFNDPAGAPVPFAASWDATKTILTIDPTADLTPDNDDLTQYRLYIARPIRSLYKDSGAIYELKDVTILFNVLSPTAGDLLGSQAPGLDPQSEVRTGYVFDADQLYEQGLQAGTTVPDFVTPAGANTFNIKWARVAGAKGYNVWWRNSFHQTSGQWTKHNGGTQVTEYDGSYRPDGTFSYSITNFYSLLAVDNLLVAGEKVQFVVTAVDKDNNESSINTVTMPLTISDTYKPTVDTATNSATTLAVARPESFGPVVNRSVTLDFSEYMDAGAAEKAPAITNLSGMVTALAAANPVWLSRTSFKSDVALTFPRPATTLSRPASAGDTKLQVDMGVATFKFAVGDTIQIKNLNAGDLDNFVTRTIDDIDTQSNLITINAALGAGFDFPVGSTVRLLTKPSIAGLTTVITTVNGDHFNGASTIAVAAGTGTLFHKGQSIQFVLGDEEGFTSLGTATVDVPNADNLVLTGQITFDIVSGATVTQNGVSLAELAPRTSQAFTISNNPLFTDHVADETILSDNFSGNPDSAGDRDKVIVASIAKLSANDVVIIEKSVNDKTTAANMTALTFIPLAAHGYLEGDTIIVEGGYETRTLTASADNGTTLTVNANFTVMDNEPLEIYDPAFSTALTAATENGPTTAGNGVGDNTLTVGSDLGIAKDMTISVTDGVKSITATVASVSNNIVTLTANVGLDHTFPVGTRVFRARIPGAGTNALQVNGGSTGTTVTVDAVGGDYSRTAILAVNRPHEKVTVAAVTNLDQIPVTLANLRPTGTKVGLWSFDETRTITAVDRDLNELTFNSALLYSHRRTARVRKAKQDWLVMATNQAAVEGKVVLGDTIAIDTLTAGLTEANADRIYATVSGIDSERDRIRITIDKAGVAIGPSASFMLMGDAATVTTVPDANGNALQGYLNRFNLNDGTIR